MGNRIERKIRSEMMRLIDRMGLTKERATSVISGRITKSDAKFLKDNEIAPSELIRAAIAQLREELGVK